MDTLTSLHFHGPFTFVDYGHGIATCEFAESAGIYLWALTDGNSRYIHYIGQTPKFLSRHESHLVGILGFYYGLFPADAVAANSPDWLFPGMWRLWKTHPGQDSLTTTVTKWKELQGRIVPYLESMEVFFAPTPALTKNERCHIEGCMAQSLRTHPENARFYPVDNRALIVGPMLNRVISLTSDKPIMGLESLLPV